MENTEMDALFRRVREIDLKPTPQLLLRAQSRFKTEIVSNLRQIEISEQSSLLSKVLDRFSGLQWWFAAGALAGAITVYGPGLLKRATEFTNLAGRDTSESSHSSQPKVAFMGKPVAIKLSARSHEGRAAFARITLPSELQFVSEVHPWAGQNQVITLSLTDPNTKIRDLEFPVIVKPNAVGVHKLTVVYLTEQNQVLEEFFVEVKAIQEGQGEE